MTSARVLDIRNRLKAEHEQRRAEATRLRRERLARLPAGLVWRIGRVAPGRDFAVERGLVEAGLFAFAPRLTVTIGDRARRRDVDRPLFPGYVFFAIPVKEERIAVRALMKGFEPMTLTVVDPARARRALERQTPAKGLFGVEGLTGALADAEGRWRAVSDAVVRKLMQAEQAGLFDNADATRKARLRSAVRKGDSVAILDGPFRAMVARVVCVKAGERLKLLLNFLGGEVTAEAALDSVALVASQ